MVKPTAQEHREYRPKLGFKVVAATVRVYQKNRYLPDNLDCLLDSEYSTISAITSTYLFVK